MGEEQSHLSKILHGGTMEKNRSIVAKKRIKKRKSRCSARFGRTTGSPPGQENSAGKVALARRRHLRSWKAKRNSTLVNAHKPLLDSPLLLRYLGNAGRFAHREWGPNGNLRRFGIHPRSVGDGGAIPVLPQQLARSVRLDLDRFRSWNGLG